MQQISSVASVDGIRASNGPSLRNWRNVPRRRPAHVYQLFQGRGGSELPEPQLPGAAPQPSNPQFATLIQKRPPIPHGTRGGGKLILAANRWTFSDSFCLPVNEHKTGQHPLPSPPSQMTQLLLEISRTCLLFESPSSWLMLL